MIAGIIPNPAEFSQLDTVRELLAESVERSGDDTLDEVMEGIRDRTSQLWGVLDDGKLILAAVTQIVPVRAGKQAFCWHMGGNFTRGGEMLVEVFLEWARNEGCVSAEIVGRLGWTRKLTDWKPTAVVLRKELVA